MASSTLAGPGATAVQKIKNMQITVTPQAQRDGLTGLSPLSEARRETVDTGSGSYRVTRPLTQAVQPVGLRLFEPSVA